MVFVYKNIKKYRIILIKPSKHWVLSWKKSMQIMWIYEIKFFLSPGKGTTISQTYTSLIVIIGIIYHLIDLIELWTVLLYLGQITLLGNLWIRKGNTENFY